jgi:hypothetical protein
MIGNLLYMLLTTYSTSTPKPDFYYSTIRRRSNGKDTPTTYTLSFLPFMYLISLLKCVSGTTFPNGLEATTRCHDVKPTFSHGLEVRHA